MKNNVVLEGKFIRGTVSWEGLITFYVEVEDGATIEVYFEDPRKDWTEWQKELETVVSEGSILRVEGRLTVSQCGESCRPYNVFAIRASRLPEVIW